MEFAVTAVGWGLLPLPARLRPAAAWLPPTGFLLLFYSAVGSTGDAELPCDPRTPECRAGLVHMVAGMSREWVADPGVAARLGSLFLGVRGFGRATPVAPAGLPGRRPSAGRTQIRQFFRRATARRQNWLPALLASALPVGVLLRPGRSGGGGLAGLAVLGLAGCLWGARCVGWWVG